MPSRTSFRWRSLLLCGVAFAVLYGRVFAELAADWERDDNYSHGFLIVPAAAWLAWRRRDEIAQLPLAPSLTGLLVVVGSLFVLMLGTAGVELFLTRVSMIGVLVGGVAYLAGWSQVRALAFPLGFLLLMIPLPSIVFNQVAFPLQLAASSLGVELIRLADVAVLREGNVIVLANTTLEVAEACSGIRSLVSLLTMALLYSYLSEPHLVRRVLIAASAVPIAVLTNGLRVAATGVAAHHYGPQVTTGFLHGLSGWIVFVASLALIVLLAHALRFIPGKVTPAVPVSQPAL